MDKTDSVFDRLQKEALQYVMSSLDDITLSWEEYAYESSPEGRMAMASNLL